MNISAASFVTIPPILEVAAGNILVNVSRMSIPIPTITILKYY
jgi:hypothetical protein